MAVVDVRPVDERVVGAALSCIARWGLRRSTFDDIAREAGCSRATLYRVCPGGRDALVTEVVRAEAARLVAAVELAVGDATSLPDALTAALVTSGRFVTTHQALRFLLRHEPEAVLPHLVFRGAEHVLCAAGACGPALFWRWCDAREATRLGEWVARMVLGYTLVPSVHVDLTDAESVGRLVRSFAPRPTLSPSR